MQPVKVGLIGLGTVGAGTVTVLARNHEEISRRAGREINICLAATRHLDRARACPMEGIKLSTDPMEVAANPDLDVVVELMGGVEAAKSAILHAIENGKHIVTANKHLIALHGNEIFSAAQDKGVMVAFEAAVAGGIPIIKALREGLAGNRIESLAGIINGTGNFILTEMRDKGREFSEVLQQAQELGYAEADPRFDVEGIDAAHKLTILAAIAFGVPLQFDKIYTEGISQISPADVTYAQELGYRIKHLGITRRTKLGLEMRVHPCLIPYRRLIANVDGVLNAVLVKGDAVGHTLYYGAGAGAEPTASAVVADLVDVVRTLTTDPENRVPHLAFQPDAMSDIPILAMDQVETAYYLRLQAKDEPGVLAEVTKILADHQISIEAVIQKEPNEDERFVAVILLTQKTIEHTMNAAINSIEALTKIGGKVIRIRVEHLS